MPPDNQTAQANSTENQQNPTDTNPQPSNSIPDNPNVLLNTEWNTISWLVPNLWQNNGGSRITAAGWANYTSVVCGDCSENAFTPYRPM